MPRAYVEVPAEAIRSLLVGAGFRLMEPHGYGPSAGAEEVYFRAHNKDEKLAIKVYSSVRRSASVARACAQDSIKVIGLRNVPGKGWVGVYKAKHVHRMGTVEAVLSRLLERMQETYAHLNELRIQDRARQQQAQRRTP
jgi:hypothetical protein